MSFGALDGHRDAAVSALIPVRRMLTSLPAVHLTDEGVRLAQHGRRLGPDTATSEWPDTVSAASASGSPIRLIAPDGELVGLARSEAENGQIHPFIVLTSGLM